MGEFVHVYNDGGGIRDVSVGTGSGAIISTANYADKAEEMQKTYLRKAGAIAIDWSATFGALTLATGGTAAACALDTTVLFDGKPTVKCTFSTTANDTYVGRYTLTDGISFKKFKNIVIPLKITASDAVGNVGTAANPFGIWIKTASAKQYRLRLNCDGVGPDGWQYFSFNPSETTGLVTFANGAVSFAELDTETVTAIDIVQASGAGLVSNAYPVWIGPILRDVISNPIITLRMDGEYSSQYSLIYPLLKKYGLKASLMLTHSDIAAGGRMSVAQINEMYAYGCEVGLHTFDSTKVNGYANATDWPTGVAIANDIIAGISAQRTNAWYRGIGTLAEGFAGNYFSGATTLARQKIIKQALLTAGVECLCTLQTSGLIKNQACNNKVKPLQVRANVSLTSTTLASAVVTQINQIAASGEWLIILMHSAVLDTATPVGNEIRIGDLETIFAAIASVCSSGGENLCLGNAYTKVYQ